MQFDLHEQGATQFASKEAAQNYFDALRRSLPEAESAYQPSGVMPASALLLLIAGSPLAIGSSYTAGLIALALGAAVTAVIVGLNVLTMVCGWVVCIFAILSLLAALATYGFVFGAAGYWSAKATASLGRWGKNRNAACVGAFAAVYAVAASVLLMISVWMEFVVEANVLDVLTDPLQWITTRDWMFWTLTGVGVLIAAFIAWAMAESFVAEDKFCEACEAYMFKEELPRVTLGGLRALAVSVASEDIQATANTITQAPGRDGAPNLFHCHQCGSGFLDVICIFEASRPDDDGKQESVEEEWLVASCALDDQQTKLLFGLREPSLR